MGAKKILITSSIFLMAVAATLPAFAATRYTARHHRTRVRRVAWNPVLRGLQLPRIADNDQLLELERTQELIPIQESRALRINPSLQADKKYCRPWCNQFLQDMSEAYFKEFHTALQVNSAVRTMEQQQKLRRHNRNAAPEVGEHASSHLAGITVDLAKRGLTRSQHTWIETYLKNLRDQGLVEAAEERRQACFHVMVSDRYTEWREANQLADKIARE
jgi:hypothetical protein